MGKAINFCLRFVIFTLIFFIGMQSGYAQKAGTISGTIVITEGEKPPSGYIVELYNTNYNFSRVTGQDGQFVFNDIPIGEYNLVIYTPQKKLLDNAIPYQIIILTKNDPKEEVIVKVSITNEKEDRTGEPVSQKSGSIRGTVVDNELQKLKGYKVVLRDEDRKGYYREDFTDELGKFEFINLKLGGYYIEVVCPNGKRARKDIVTRIYEDSPHQYNLELTVPDGGCQKEPNNTGNTNTKTGNIEIKVIPDQKGNNQSFSVELRDTYGVTKYNKWTDSNGYVLFTDIPYGNYRVWISSPEMKLLSNSQDAVISTYVPFDSLTIKINSSGTPPKNNSKEKKKEGTGEVEVELISEEPIAKYLVVLTNGNEALFHEWKWTQNNKGVVVFKDVPFGTYEMQVFSADRKQLKNGINVPLSKLFPTFITQINLGDVASPNKGSVTITAVQGNTFLPQATVVLLMGGIKINEALTDYDGTVTFDNLAYNTPYTAEVYGPKEDLLKKQDFYLQLGKKNTELLIDINQNNSDENEEEDLEVTLTFYQDANMTQKATGNYSINLTRLEGKRKTYQGNLQNGTYRETIVPGKYGILVQNPQGAIFFDTNFTFTPENPEQKFVLNEDIEDGETDSGTYHDGFTRGSSKGKGTFEGIIKTEDGGSNLYRLELIRADAGEIWRDWCDKKGNFRFEKLPMGTYEFRIYSSETQKLLSKNTTFSLSELFPRVYREIKIGEKAKEVNKGIIEGSVRQKGKEENIFRLKLASEKDDFHRWTEPDGSFRFDGIPFGTYKLSIYSFPENTLLVEDMKITISKILPLATRHVVFSEDMKVVKEQKKENAKEDEEKEKGTIIIQVEKPGGANQKYFVVLLDEGPVFKGYTDAKGHITFKGVPYGSYVVQVFSSEDQELLKTDSNPALNFSGLFDPHRMKITLPKSPTEKKGTLDIQITQKDVTKEKYFVVLYDAITGTVTSYKSYTDEDGFIVFDNIPLKSYRIHVYSQDNKFLNQEHVASLSELLPKTSVKIEIPSPKKEEKKKDEPKCIGNLEGKILDDKGDKTYRLKLSSGNSKDAFRWTNQYGYFIFENVDCGFYNLKIYSSPDQSLFHEANVEISELFPSVFMEIDLKKEKKGEPEKPKPGTIMGKVIDKLNPNALYHVALIHNGQMIRDKTFATDKDGQFRIESLDFGTYEINVYSDMNGGPSQKLAKEVSVTLSPYIPYAHREIDLTNQEKWKKETDKSPVGILTGAVKKEGENVHNYKIMLESGTKTIVKDTEPPGTFKIEDIPLGNYSVKIYDLNGNLKKDDIDRVEFTKNFQKHDLGTINLKTVKKTKGEIVGTLDFLKLAKDKPAPPALVVIKDVEGNIVKKTETDDEGKFHFTDLDLGTYWLKAYSLKEGEEGKELKQPKDDDKMVPVDIKFTLTELFNFRYFDIGIGEPPLPTVNKIRLKIYDEIEEDLLVKNDLRSEFLEDLILIENNETIYEYGDFNKFRVLLLSLENDKVISETWMTSGAEYTFRELQLNKLYKVEIYVSNGEKIDLENKSCLQTKLSNVFPARYIYVKRKILNKKKVDEDKASWERTYNTGSTSKKEKKDEKIEVKTKWECNQWPTSN